MRRYELGPTWAMDTAPAEARAWRYWVERHGLHPSDIAVPGVIEVDDDARTISFPTFHRDRAGKAHLASDCGGPEYQLCQYVAVLQLEAPALPFPA